MTAIILVLYLIPLLVILFFVYRNSGRESIEE